MATNRADWQKAKKDSEALYKRQNPRGTFQVKFKEDLGPTLDKLDALKLPDNVNYESPEYRTPEFQKKLKAAEPLVAKIREVAHSYQTSIKAAIRDEKITQVQAKPMLDTLVRFSAIRTTAEFKD